MRLFITFVLALFCIFLSACTASDGNVDNVEITIGASEKFSVIEIKEAINLVKEHFVTYYFGSELLQLWYDEIRSEQQINFYMNNGRGRSNGVIRDNVIILFSNFHVGSRACMTFYPNTIYKEWVWILIRDSADDPWRIDDWGF